MNPSKSLLSFLIIVLATAITQTTDRADFHTGETGHRVSTNQHSQAIGLNGPVLLRDINALEKLRRFETEIILVLVLHPRVAGVLGEFVSTGESSSLHDHCNKLWGIAQRRDGDSKESSSCLFDHGKSCLIRWTAGVQTSVENFCLTINYYCRIFNLAYTA